VLANHRHAPIRQAGYLYLLVAHVGALGILLCFGVLQAGTGDYTFANMRQQNLTPFWGSVAFVLAVFGFGAKAGLLPLHAWLPEAHPAAPSPISALMSGVMLKIALYGILRVAFDLLQTRIWWWGVLLMAIGPGHRTVWRHVFHRAGGDETFAGLFLHRKHGPDVRRFGAVAAVFCLRHARFAALALTAALYHMISHAFFKSLLFCSTGAVLHATGERSLGKLGGLIRYMPWVAWPTLIGALACAGSAAFGGFVAEWLLLQSFLFTTGLPNTSLDMLVPVMAALIALIAALSGFTMVKYFGVIFLGQPREQKLAQAHDAGLWERLGMLWLVAGCVVLGLLPNQVIALIDPVTRMLVHGGLAHTVAESGWLLVPVNAERASYAPVIFFLGMMASFGCLSCWCASSTTAARRVPPWDCGHPWQTARMQDTAEGFGQPIRRIFSPIFPHEANSCRAPFDTEPALPHDGGRPAVARPVPAAGAVVERISKVVGLLQQGRIAVYLMYSFATLDRGAAGGETMSHATMGIFSQLAALLTALLLAPLLTGWVNQCRALACKTSRRPAVLQPYRQLHKLFHKESLMAEHASSLYRMAPYLIFGCMLLACAIIPVFSTDLPLSPAADAIALVGLFALARVFISLAAMDIGTAFGTLGARREMLVGFLAEPALLMVLFCASMITRSTSLTAPLWKPWRTAN
jgi:hydrogenase-4 component B